MRFALASLTALILAAIPAGALADAIPGATYTGVASDGAGITLTISSDGTLVQSYEIQGVHGNDAKGNGCTLYSQGDAGVWPGAPVTADAFESSEGSEFTLAGSFSGQSASGTFAFDNPPLTNSAGTVVSTGCSTGIVNWTVTTTSPGDGSAGGTSTGGTSPGGTSPGGTSPGGTSPGGTSPGGTSPGGTSPGTSPGGSSPGAGAGPGGSGGNGSAGSSVGRREVVTLVAFARLSATKLGGRVRSGTAACLSRRTVYLWRGKHRVGRTRTSRHGTYSFAVTRKLRKQSVRASVLARTVDGVICAAASSTFIGA